MSNTITVDKQKFVALIKTLSHEDIVEFFSGSSHEAVATRGGRRRTPDSASMSKKILALKASGLGPTDIARKLGITKSTVSYHAYKKPKKEAARGEVLGKAKKTKLNPKSQLN